MLELATLADRDAVEALAQQVHAMHVSWRPDIYQDAQVLYDEERFDIAVRGRQLYVAKIGGIVVGYARLKIGTMDWNGIVRRKILFVDELCVHDSCRGQGIGTRMMEDARALAKAFGCTDMQLGVYPQNDAAVSFYQKCGFMIQNINMQRKT